MFEAQSRTNGAGSSLRRLAGLLVPPICVTCRRACDRERPLCGDCTRELNASPVLRGDPPDGIEAIVSCAPHEGVA
ncbi:MAG: hypothetical protein M3Y45_02050, partial [Actinomycetota bacterium]|nr:hypothetical protein [Actinomycetota bacterium]